MKTINLTVPQLTNIIKKTIMENYPLGAKYDSEAPYNQIGEEPNFGGDFELEPIYNENGNYETFNVILNDENHKATISAYDIFSDLEYTDEEEKIANLEDDFKENENEIKILFKPLLEKWLSSNEPTWEEKGFD